MKVLVVLADKGTINPQQGTLNLLNAGWTQTHLRPAPQMMPGAFITAPHAVAAFFEVEYAHCNHPIELVLALLTEDGRPVQLPAPAGPQEIVFRQMLTIQTPGGAPYGTPGVGNALVEIAPGLPLPAGGYRWNVTLDNEHHEDWYAAFRVVQPPQMPGVVFGTPQPPPDTP